MSDDAELLRRFALEGAQDDFAELVERHLPLVYGAALRQVDGNVHLAEEVAQAVFTMLARRAASLADHPRLAGWLFVTTRHTAHKQMRSERRRQRREHTAYAMNENDSASIQAEWQRLRPVLDEVIHELGDVDREAILLRFFEQRPYLEIGRALQTTEDAARRRVDRALDKLRELLAAREITSTAAALPLLRVIAGLKLPLATAALSLALLVGVAWREIRAGREAGAALDRLDRDSRAQLAALRDLGQRTQQAEQDRAGLEQRIAAARAARAGAGAWDPAAEGVRFLTAHPEVKRAMIDHSRAKLNFRYASFVQSLGLDAAKISRFQDLMRELEPGNDSMGIDGRRMIVREGDGMPRADAEGALAVLLGPEGYRALAAAKQSQPARRLTFELAEALYFTAAPLSAEQSDQLVQTIAAAGTPRGFDWAAISAKAATFLAAEQMAGLGGLRARDEAAKLMGVRWIGALPPPSGTWIPAK